MRARSVDCSGFIRTVFGYRARYPLMSSDRVGRRPAAHRQRHGPLEGRASTCIPLNGISAPTDRPRVIDELQPGDLVFFKLDARTEERLDHVGMYSATTPTVT